MLDELLTMLEELADNHSDKNENLLYESAKEVIENLGIENKVDYDSLKKAANEAVKNNKDLSLDIEGAAKEEKIDLYTEDYPDFIDVKISFAQFKMLLSILRAIKTKKVYKWMLQDNTINDTPLSEMIIGITIKKFLSNLEETEMKLDIQAFLKKLPTDFKFKFVAE